MQETRDERTLQIDNDILSTIFGRFDENLNLIRQELNIDAIIRKDKLSLFGHKDSIDIGEKLFYNLEYIVKNQKSLEKQDILYAIALIKEGKEDELKQMLKEVICTSFSGKPIKAKTLGQKRYIDSIKNNHITFGIGPAGTGKTYLAMAMAVCAFRNKEVSRIVLARPAVEAGESLGFLPGDLQEKVDPYLRPLYDALFDLLGYETYLRYIEKGLIEVAPLAYMRGRTLDSAFVILDEAQNSTNEQMKMFLTRIGFGSKAVITGDITQIDLAKGRKSGLVTVNKILKDIKGIEFSYFSKHDVVRHPIVQRIIQAYEEHEEGK